MKYAFQYYNGRKMVADFEGLYAEETKRLWNEYKDSFEKDVERGQYDAAMCIWESNDITPYASELIYLIADECIWKNGILYKLVKAFPTAEEW